MRDPSLVHRLSLIVVTDADCGDGRTIVDVVGAALRGGAPAIQLRDKRGDARDMLELARRLLVETRAAGALLFVNDRVDIALAAGADGVHVGDDDLPVAAVRAIAHEGFLIGRSVDDVAGARAAQAAGADYLGVGPVYETPSKLDAGPVTGIEGVRRVCAAVDVPVVAIGGVGVGNAGQIAEAGAAGIAVIRAVMQAADPGEASATLVRAVREGRPDA